MTTTKPPVLTDEDIERICGLHANHVPIARAIEQAVLARAGADFAHGVQQGFNMVDVHAHRDAALEEAALAILAGDEKTSREGDYMWDADDCARAIRALKGTPAANVEDIGKLAEEASSPGSGNKAARRIAAMHAKTGTPAAAQSNWCSLCGCGNDKAGYAHLDACPTLRTPAAAVAAIDINDDCKAADGPLLDLDMLLADFHSTVWAAAESGNVDYDDAGSAEAKAIQKKVREIIAMERAAAVAKPSAVMTMTVAQVRQLLSLSAGDDVSDDAETQVSLCRGAGADGNGLYFWGTDYPEEGAMLLDGAPAAAVADATAAGCHECHITHDLGACPQLSGNPGQVADAQPVPFRVGNEYQTQAGDWVRFVSVHNEGTDYETMADEAGRHRYTNRADDMGRLTATAHDYSNPGNTPPLYAAQPSAQAQPFKNIEELPPLPVPDLGMPWRVNAPDGSVHCAGYTADQMRAYALAAQAQPSGNAGELDLLAALQGLLAVAGQCSDEEVAAVMYARAAIAASKGARP